MSAEGERVATFGRLEDGLREAGYGYSRVPWDYFPHDRAFLHVRRTTPAQLPRRRKEQV